MCRPDQKKIYGVARNEAAEIICEVDAFPLPETFKWSFNNTAETFDMPENGFEKYSPRASKLTYVPVKVSNILRIKYDCINKNIHSIILRAHKKTLITFD